MITGRPLLAILVMALLGFPLIETKAATSKQTDLYMVMHMAGVTAGSMKLSINDNDDHIVSSLKLRSEGLIKLITGYKGLSEARSTRPESSWPMPISYDSTYETRKYDREIQIKYDPEDGNITDLQTWKRSKPRKSKVPEALRLATIDPLTAILRLRHWIQAIRADGATAASRTFEIFDGRRRYRLDAEILDRREVELDDKTIPAFRLKVDMTPMAGFSSKDMLANWSSEDGQRWIELVITDEDNPIPFSLRTVGGSLETTIELQKICTGDDQCTKIDG